MMLSVACSICFLLMCVGFIEPESINPKKLLIATVIDPSNNEVVRDSLTLIRSIRLFGGSLNEATFIVAISVNTSQSFTNEKLVHQLYELDIKVSFVSQVQFGMARTLNKFETFRLFDTLKFDYFLWLDADIVVFSDPLVHLRLHRHPGEIQCVPDLYSYTRRYPLINTTSIIWNPNLAPFRLIGDDEVAPHGTCNTGVLFFDKLSMKSFLIGLDLAMKDEYIRAKYGHDRFIDSLYFLHAIHSQGIEVSIFPFSMNYMVFFEGELQQDTDVQDIIFAHFLSDTLLYCISMPPTTAKDDIDNMSSPQSIGKDCRCIYENSMFLQNSLIVRTIDKLLPLDVCLVMAGDKLPLNRSINVEISKNMSVDDNIDFDMLNTNCSDEKDGGVCKSTTIVDEVAKALTEQSTFPALLTEDNHVFSAQLLWPSSRYHLEQVSSVDTKISMHTEVNIQYAKSLLDFYPELTVRLRYIVRYLSCDELRESLTSSSSLTTQSPFITSHLHDVYCGVVTQSKNIGHLIGGNTVCESTTSINLSSSTAASSDCNSDCDENVVNIPSTLRFYLNNHTNSSQREQLELDFPDMLPLKLEVVAYITRPSSESGVSMSHVPELHRESRFIVTVTSRQSVGQVAYSVNPLIGSQRIILESQSQLPEYLRDRHLGSGVGVVHCCETHKGVATVNKLIKHWHGDTVIIFVTAAPSDVSVSQLATDLQYRCNSRLVNTKGDDGHLEAHAKCVIYSESVLSMSQLADMMYTSGAHQMLSFVFIDVYTHDGLKLTSRNSSQYVSNYQRNVVSIMAWHKLLRKGGVVLGSRLGRRGAVSNVNTLYRNNSEHDGVVRHVVVDYIVYSIQTSYLATYLEYDDEFCEIRGECNPAWYFLKNV